MRHQRYELIGHTADIGLRAYGRSLAELFANAALGMQAIIQPAQGAGGEEGVAVAVDGLDAEHLLVRWLSELLHLSREGWVFSRFDITGLSDRALEADCFGQRRPAGAAPRTEIKMVTHHGVKIIRTGCGCRVDVIFDV